VLWGRALGDAWLTERIKEIHKRARGVYGSRRVTAELRLGQGIEISSKRRAAADEKRRYLGSRQGQARQPLPSGRPRLCGTSSCLAAKAYGHCVFVLRCDHMVTT
jgi:hypothetical protein